MKGKRGHGEPLTRLDNVQIQLAYLVGWLVNWSCKIIILGIAYWVMIKSLLSDESAEMLPRAQIHYSTTSSWGDMRQLMNRSSPPLSMIV
jgi:hypothetical protein